MKNRFIYLILFTSLFISCDTNQLDVDVSKINVKIEHINVVNEFKYIKNISDAEKANQVLLEKGDELYEYYLAKMLQVGLPNQDSTPVFLNHFIQDSIMQILNSKIETKFGNFEAYRLSIVDMFKHLNYHIPRAALPEKIMTYNSTFTNGVISTPNKIGVGLEMYLGANDEIVKAVRFPEYFKVKMDAQFLLADIANNWLVSNVLEELGEESFLSNLIYYGKLMYLIKALLPNESNHVILRYTQAEYDWVEESEYDVWQYVVQKDWIYSTDVKLMLKFFRPGPTTSGIDGSPDRLGQYLGWRIINNYMDRYPEITVKELIAEKNTTKILKSYKPRK